MTIQKRFVPPALPLPTEEYSARYTNEMNKILRLYFENNDAVITAILTLLNEGGYFPQITAGTVTSDRVVTQALESIGITASNLNSNYITSGAFQGGNGVFNNLTASQVNASLFTGSGREINLPHAALSDQTDQYASASNTPTIVKFDATDEARGFTLNNDETITATYDGVYKVDYSFQFVNTDNVAHEIDVWLKVNGNNVAKSTSKFSIPPRKSAGVYSYLVAYSSLEFQINAGDALGLWWATNQAYNPTGPVDGVYMEYIPIQTSPYAHPSAPSAITNITYVSAPDPAMTRVTPVSAPGTGKVGSPTIRIVNNNA